MIPPMFIYMLCGLTAGLLGGYLGLGGGIIMVPFLTIAAGLDIKVAVPVSVTATVVTSIASSNEYLKKGMTEWISGWIKRGWKNSQKKDVANKDLWQELLKAVEGHDIEWTWVRGHAGHPDFTNGM